MYQNPKHLRDREVKVRFDGATMATIDGLALICRKQRAVFLRDLILDEVRRRLEDQGSVKTACEGRA